MEVNIHEAKTHLSRLVENVLAGEEVIIAKAGRPVAKLVRLEPSSPRRALGTAQGQIRFRKGWNKPMTAKELREFLGE